MVRLKPHFLYKEFICFFKFQFLYGAIKTAHLDNFSSDYDEFQFLYGAIKT